MYLVVLSFFLVSFAAITPGSSALNYVCLSVMISMTITLQDSTCIAVFDFGIFIFWSYFLFALCHFCKLAVKWSVFYMMVLKPYYHSVSLHIPWYTWKDTMICQPSYMLKHTPLNSQTHEELWLPETKVLEFLVQFWPSHYHAMTCSCRVV